MNKIGRYICMAMTIALLTLTGCKSQKSSSSANYTTVANADARYSEITAAYSDWTTFTASGKVAATIGKSLSSSTTIKMIKGKSISISIRPLLGIELMKVYIDNDSAYIIDKTHSAYTSLGLKQFTGEIPVTLNDLQDMLLNRAFIIGSGTLSTDTKNSVALTEADNNCMRLMPKKALDGITYSFLFNSDNNLQQLNTLIDSTDTQPLSVEYSGFTSAIGGNIAQNTTVNINIEGTKATLAITLDTTKVKWNTTFDDTLTIGRGYSKKTLSQFMKLW